jgi:predicted permease
MQNFILIFMCLALGVALQRVKKFPEQTSHVLNAFVIYISFPALILTKIPPFIQSLSFSFETLVPVSMPWVLFFLSFLFFFTLGEKFKWKRSETGALILTAGLANTSFVGFPMLESLLGRESIQVAILIDQFGSFLVLSTAAILVATVLSPVQGRKISKMGILKSIFFFPPFSALLVASLWSISGYFDADLALVETLRVLGRTLAPLALVAVGFQLRVSRTVLKKYYQKLAIGLLFKLVLAPIFFIILYVFIFSSRTFSTHITILEAAMAPMITSAVLVDEFKFNNELANLMVGLGIIFSLVSVYLWNIFLEGSIF